MKESIGEYIKRLRTDANMTLTKLAAALDIDQSTLSKIENKKRNIPEELLPKLANVFNLDLTELNCEYFSEIIAELIYRQEDHVEILKLTRKKVEYLKKYE